MAAKVDLRHITDISEDGTHFHVNKGARGIHSVPKKGLDKEVANHLRSFAKGIAAARVAAKNMSGHADDGVKVSDAGTKETFDKGKAAEDFRDLVSKADEDKTRIPEVIQAGNNYLAHSDPDADDNYGLVEQAVQHYKGIDPTTYTVSKKPVEAAEDEAPGDENVEAENAHYWDIKANAARKQQASMEQAAATNPSTTGPATDADLNKMVQGATRQGWTQNPAYSGDNAKFAAPVNPPVQSNEELAANSQSNAFIQKAAQDRQAAIAQQNAKQTTDANALATAAQQDTARGPVGVTPGQTAPSPTGVDGATGNPPQSQADVAFQSQPAKDAAVQAQADQAKQAAIKISAQSGGNVQDQLAAGQAAAQSVLSASSSPATTTVSPSVATTAAPSPSTTNTTTGSFSSTPGAPPPAVPSPAVAGADTALLKKWDEWQNSYNEAEEKQANLQQWASAKKAALEGESVERQQASQLELQRNLGQFNKEADASIAWLRDPANKLDPSRIFHKMNWGQGILTFVGSVLGGVGAGLTHTPNGFWEVVDKGIERDVRAQMQEREDQQTIYNLNKGKALVATDAYKLAHAAELDRVAGLTLKIGDQFTGMNAHNAATQIATEARMKATALRQSVELNNQQIKNYPENVRLQRELQNVEIQEKQANIQNLKRQQVAAIVSRNRVLGADPYEGITEQMLIDSGMKTPGSKAPAAQQPVPSSQPQASVQGPRMGPLEPNDPTAGAILSGIWSHPETADQYAVQIPVVRPLSTEPGGKTEWETVRDRNGNIVKRAAWADPKDTDTRTRISQWTKFDDSLNEIKKNISDYGSLYPAERAAAKARMQNAAGQYTKAGGDRVVASQVENFIDQLPDTGSVSAALLGKTKALMDVALHSHYAEYADMTSNTVKRAGAWNE